MVPLRCFLGLLLDFSNISLAFFGHIFLKVPLLLFPIEHVSLLIGFFVVNVYVCYATMSAKNEVVQRVLEGFDRWLEKRKEETECRGVAEEMEEDKTEEEEEEEEENTEEKEEEKTEEEEEEKIEELEDKTEELEEALQRSLQHGDHRELAFDKGYGTLPSAKTTFSAEEEVIQLDLDGFDRRLRNDEEDRDKVEEVLQSSLQWGDLGELAFGKCKGRYVTEWSLLLVLFFEAVAALCCVLDLSIVPVVLPSNSSSDVQNVTKSIAPILGRGAFPLYNWIFIAFILTSVFSLEYRSYQTRLVSLVGMMSLLVAIIIALCPHDELQLSDSDRSVDMIMKERITKMYGAPQIAVMMLAIHGSLKENRKHFSKGLLISCAFCFFDVFAVTIGNMSWGFESQLSDISFLSLFPMRLLLIIGYLTFFWLLNFPLCDLSYRYIKKIRGTTGSELFPLLPSSDSIFIRLRLSSRCTLAAKDITDQMDRKAKCCTIIFVKLFIVLFEMGYAALYEWFSLVMLQIHACIEWTASIWVGVVMPVLIFLKLTSWKTPTPKWRLHKVFSILLIVSSVVWTFYVYISVILQFNPFIQDKDIWFIRV